MPEAMERALEAAADKKGYSGKRRNAFIYGTMRKSGWKPKREKKEDKGREQRLALGG